MPLKSRNIDAEGPNRTGLDRIVTPDQLKAPLQEETARFREFVATSAKTSEAVRYWLEKNSGKQHRAELARLLRGKVNGVTTKES
ncbi:MAG: hypothetical protein WCT53_05470 [Candidatus Gracilibacteria bacterium]|jgi:hypothetical protein